MGALDGCLPRMSSEPDLHTGVLLCHACLDHQGLTYTLTEDILFTKLCMLKTCPLPQSYYTNH